MQNTILRTNLTKWAIILQASSLNSTAHSVYLIRSHPQDGLYTGLFLFCLVPLLLCSVWMACNLRHEPDKVRRRKNAGIELSYCCMQALFGFMIAYVGIGLLGTALILIVGVIYLLYVNPKYMNRKMTR